MEPAQALVRDREQELVLRLQELMSKSAVYRDSNITIASLATRLGVPERKLREPVNRRLAFRNFSAYVNAFRLEEVRRRLMDPRQNEVPVLTLALEAGFGSVVAFNRAFKDKHGMTPTAYRAHHNDERATTRHASV
jgi:AraC-like DNA-binding protein